MTFVLKFILQMYDANRARAMYNSAFVMYNLEFVMYNSEIQMGTDLFLF